METNKENYMQILDKNEDLDIVRVLREKLNRDQQRQLIEDILSEQVEHLMPFLKKTSSLGRMKFQFTSLFYSPAELAFNVLSEMDSEWLNKHIEYFEQRFEQAWKGTKKRLDKPQKEQKEVEARENLILEKIKVLVANTRAGMRPVFLSSFIQSNNIDIMEELELYLLCAKLEEEYGPLDLDAWDRRIHLEEKPELSALFLYILRKQNPLRGIRQFLLIEGEISENPDPRLEQFLAVYLRQSIYQLLHESENDQYVEFFRIMESTSTQWVRDLFEGVLEHPALEDINEKYKSVVPAILQGNSEQHQQHIKNFEENILKNQ